MLGEVPAGEGEQGQPALNTAGGYSAVVERPRPPASLRPGGYFGPGHSDRPVAGKDGLAGEPEIEATAGLMGADRMCISTDYPHFDSSFPEVANNLLKGVSRETAAQILAGGAALWHFTGEDYRKADLAMDRFRQERSGVAERVSSASR